MGVPGTVRGVTDTAADAAPAPTAVRARSLTEYVVPLASWMARTTNTELPAASRAMNCAPVAASVPVMSVAVPEVSTFCRPPVLPMQ